MSEALRGSAGKLKGEGFVIDVHFIAEAGRFWIAFPGMPFHSEGLTEAAAIDDAVDALRTYADYWSDHLYKFPDHAKNFWLVEWTDVSSDDDIRRALRDARSTSKPGPQDIFDRIQGNPDVIVGDPEELVHLEWNAEAVDPDEATEGP